MTYKVLLLSKEDSKDPMKTGYKYALEHEKDWMDCGLPDPDSHFATYDAARTFLVYKDVPYMISKDYIIPEKNTRLYIMINKNLSSDKVKDEEDQ